MVLFTFPASLLAAEFLINDPSTLASNELQSLLSLEIDSAKRRPDPLILTAAAAQVITQDDIRDSGATSIPELLRQVPGLEVGQISPSQWSVSSRGFSGRFANKLLVLIDGRAVYNSLYNGVYWELQVLPLASIERIEVIRGSGSALWGSNAVNGVINIITRHAAEFQGTSLTLESGSRRQYGELRQGGQLKESAYYGLGLTTESGDRFESDMLNFDTQFKRHQLTGRVDWNSERGDQFSGRVHSTVYDSNAVEWFSQQMIFHPDEHLLYGDTSRVSHALSFEWQRSISLDNELKLQLHQQMMQTQGQFFKERDNVAQIDFQHALALGSHAVVWGLGAKHSRFDVSENLESLNAGEQSLGTWNVFLQDEISLLQDSLRFTLGTKLEANDYTGREWQPQARILWLPETNSSVWAAVSRSSRIPSVVERRWSSFAGTIQPDVPDNPLGVPVNIYIDSSDDFDAETLLAYELGGRSQVTSQFAVDVALYRNHYDRLRDVVLGPVSAEGDGLRADLIVSNTISGITQGVEVLLDWKISSRLNARLAYSRIQYMLDSENDKLLGLLDSADVYEKFGPGWQSYLQFAWQPSARWHHKLSLRRVDNIPQFIKGIDYSGLDRVDTYTELNLSSSWQASRKLRLALSGHNLLHARHPEYQSENTYGIQYVPRAWFASLIYSL